MPANNDPKINDFPNSILTFLMQSNSNSLFHSFSLSPFSSWFWLVRIFSFVISKTETHTITFWINISHTKRTLHSVKICRVYIRSHHSLISVLIFGKILNFLPFSKFAAEALVAYRSWLGYVNISHPEGLGGWIFFLWGWDTLDFLPRIISLYHRAALRMLPDA